MELVGRQTQVINFKEFWMVVCVSLPFSVALLLCVFVFPEGTNVNGLKLRCAIFGCSSTCGISCQRVVLCSCLLEGRVLLPVDGELSNSC